MGKKTVKKKKSSSSKKSTKSPKKDYSNCTEKPFICPYCGVGCNMEFLVDGDGHAVKTVVRGRNPDVNGKFACIKGFSVHELLNSPERLTSPLVRFDKELEKTDWFTAINHAAKLLKSVRKKYHSKSTGMLISSKITNEEIYLAQKFARTAMYTSNIDTCARLCHAPSEVGLKRMLGFGAVSLCLEDFKKADVVVLVGANTRFTHPGVWDLLRKRKTKTTLIVADVFPVKTKYDIKLTPKPRSDLIWINGLANLIFQQGTFDVDFISRRTIGFESYVKSLEKYTKAYVEEKSGISIRTLWKIADILAGKRTIFVWGMGLTQHAHGTDAVMSLANLALLTGNLGKEGAGVVPLRGQNNVQGAGDMGGSPSTLPGAFEMDDVGIISHFEGIWNATLQTDPGFSATEMIHHIADGKIKALYVIGENPALSEPQSAFVKWMLKSPEMECLIVQDIFLTETAKMAHVVFPAAMIGEKEGLTTNAERRIQYTGKAVEPPGNAKPDWEIIQMMANVLGYDWNYRKSEEIWEEVRRVAPIFTGATYKRLIESGGLYWPIYDEKHPGTPRLYEDRFMFRDGRARFIPIPPPQFINETTEDYPFMLVTHRLFEHFNTGSMSRRSPMLMRVKNKGFVAMNEDDYKKLDLNADSIIRIESPYGTITTQPVVQRGVDVPKGFLFAPIHFFNTDNFNNLTSTYPLDPLAKMPSLKSIAVNIKKEHKFD
jgi:formate dehydrogenase alpha subunit